MVALEQLERGAVLLPGQAVTVGTHVEHLMPELLVVPQDLVDDLPRATDQGRAALDGLLERVEHWLDPPPPNSPPAGQTPGRLAIAERGEAWVTR